MNEQIGVCEKHKVDAGQECTICKLQAARNDLRATFWYLKKFCEGPKAGGSMMHGSETPPPKIILTNEEAMKAKLDHILEVATTMVGRHGGNPIGWPEEVEQP
jgi:hypothetical protein